MGVREIDRFLEHWRLNVDDVLKRMYLEPAPREQERWHALWLLVRGVEFPGYSGGLGP